MIGHRLAWLVTLGLTAACSQGEDRRTVTAAAVPAQATGTIEISAGLDVYDPPPSNVVTSLEGLRLSGPARESIGPLTVSVGAPTEIADARPGSYTASGGTLYFFNCPSVRFRVQPGKTTTLAYITVKIAGPGVDLCTVNVSGPA